MDTSTQIQRQILSLEGKSPQQIEELLKKQQGLPGLPGAASAAGPQDPGNAGPSAGSNQFSLVNIVFNYFNEQSENIDGPKNEADRERYDLLKKQAESMKTRQTEQMKFMNQ